MTAPKHKIDRTGSAAYAALLVYMEVKMQNQNGYFDIDKILELKDKRLEFIIQGDKMQKSNYFIPNCCKCSWSYSDTYDRCCDENMQDDDITDYNLCFFAQWGKPCKICRVKTHSSDLCSSCIRE